MIDEKELDIEYFTQPGRTLEELMTFVKNGQEQNCRDELEYYKAHPEKRDEMPEFLRDYKFE